MEAFEVVMVSAGELTYTLSGNQPRTPRTEGPFSESRLIEKGTDDLQTTLYGPCLFLHVHSPRVFSGSSAPFFREHY
jgi:hypothetical protein